MKCKKLALALSMGVLCALGAVALVYYPSVSQSLLGVEMGTKWLDLLVDAYPYLDPQTWYMPLLAAVYAFVDGFIFGFLLAALYNLFLGKSKK